MFGTLKNEHFYRKEGHLFYLEQHFVHILALFQGKINKENIEFFGQNHGLHLLE